MHVELSSRATFRASCSIFLCLLVLKKGGFSSYNSLFYLLSNDFFNVIKTTTQGEWLQILAPHSKDIRLFVVDLYIFMCKLTASTCIVLEKSCILIHKCFCANFFTGYHVVENFLYIWMGKFLSSLLAIKKCGGTAKSVDRVKNYCGEAGFAPVVPRFVGSPSLI